VCPSGRAFDWGASRPRRLEKTGSDARAIWPPLLPACAGQPAAPFAPEAPVTRARVCGVLTCARPTHRALAPVGSTCATTGLAPFDTPLRLIGWGALERAASWCKVAAATRCSRGASALALARRARARALSLALSRSLSLSLSLSLQAGYMCADGLVACAWVGWLYMRGWAG
jgi:hypothetical protein